MRALAILAVLILLPGCAPRQDTDWAGIASTVGKTINAPNHR